MDVVEILRKTVASIETQQNDAHINIQQSVGPTFNKAMQFNQGRNYLNVCVCVSVLPVVCVPAWEVEADI